MNFEFLKNLRGLGDLYDNCNNAEKLARTMPAQSIFTSRNCAELLAKFIYMAACNQKMEQMTFADILSDWTFRNFIRNKEVMDAFHSIRKQGNQAVHEESQNETVQNAIDVLQDLHYVTGETAQMLGLIKKYPPFESNIKKYPNAIYKNDDEINQEAVSMFLSYVEAYDAVREREQYEKLPDYELFDYSLHGDADFHEYIECLSPMRASFIEGIQDYLLGLLALMEDDGAEASGPRSAHFVIELLLDGTEIYSTADTEQLKQALEQKLPASKSFIADIFGSGKMRRFYFYEDEEDPSSEDSITAYNLVRKDRVWDGAGLLDKMESAKRRYNFVYKFFAYYPDCDEMVFHKIENGKDIDIWENASNSIINKEFKTNLWGHNLDLWVYFNFDQHPLMLEQLHDIVRKHVGESDLELCEEAWEDGEPQCLCRNIEWDVYSLKDVQRFLDEINQVIIPIKEELDPYTSGWFVSSNTFFVAKWMWTDKGFQIVGSEY